MKAKVKGESVVVVQQAVRRALRVFTVTSSINPKLRIPVKS
jgi:hypothetical protein